MAKFRRATRSTTAGDIGKLLGGFAEGRLAQQKLEVQRQRQGQAKEPSFAEKLLISQIAQHSPQISQQVFGVGGQIAQPDPSQVAGISDPQQEAILNRQFVPGQFSLVDKPEQEGTLTTTKVTGGGITAEDVGAQVNKESRLTKARELAKANVDIATEYATQKSKSKAELEVLQPRLLSIFQDTEDAFAEIEANAPAAFKQGFEGYLSRVGLKISSSKFIDEFPKVATLVDNLKADATSFAKAAGEVRPTDKDIERFLSILFDPRERSLATNIEKMKSQVRRMKNEGVYTGWADPLIFKQEARLGRIEGNTVDDLLNFANQQIGG